MAISLWYLVGPIAIGGCLFIAAVVAMILYCKNCICPKKKGSGCKSQDVELQDTEIQQWKDESPRMPREKTGSDDSDQRDSASVAEVPGPDFRGMDGTFHESQSHEPLNQECDYQIAVVKVMGNDAYAELPEESTRGTLSENRPEPDHLDVVELWREQPYQYMFMETKKLNFKTWMQARSITMMTIMKLEAQGIRHVTDLTRITEDQIKDMKLTMGECHRLKDAIAVVNDPNARLQWT